MPAQYTMWPAYAAGRVFDHSIAAALLVRVTASLEQAKLWTLAFSGQINNFKDNLVDSAYYGKEYNTLFRDLFFNEHEIVLALFRPAGVRQSPMSFVHTNPPQDTIIVQGDRYIAMCGDAISTKDVPQSPKSKSGLRGSLPSKRVSSG